MRQLLPPYDGEPDLLRVYGDAPASYVRGGFVLSVDGGAVLDGGSRALSGPADRAVFRTLRAVCDVILVGAGTARVEDYGTIGLPEAGRTWRTERGLPPLPRVAVVSRSLDLDQRLFAGARPLVVTCAAADAGPLADRADVLVAGEDDVDLPLALDLLAERGLRRVLCEGGPTLLAALLDAGRLDELCLTLTPLVTGEVPGLVPRVLDRPVALELRSLLADDGVLLARYTVSRRPAKVGGGEPA